MNEWIAVSERLPEGKGFQPVIAAPVYGKSTEILFNTVNRKFMTYGFDYIHPKRVTHWMPLPEPPKEK